MASRSQRRPAGPDAERAGARSPRSDRDELREVSAAVLAVTSRRSVREVLQTIVAAARRLIGAEYAALGVPDAQGGFAEFVADGMTDEQWAAIGPLPRQHGLLGVMLRDPHPVRLDDIRAHPDFGWWPAAHPVLTSFIGMPIVDGDEILGELFLANTGQPAPAFGADDEELLRLLAAHAAIALVNARLYERSRELSILEERHRIARELHDSVTQKLFSLRLTADATRLLLAAEPRTAEPAAATTAEPGAVATAGPGAATTAAGTAQASRTSISARAAEQLDTVRQLAAEATDELRAIMVGLRPADLAGDGVDVALRKQAELLDRAHGAAVRFRGGPVPGLAPAREEALYRVAQEAMHNALRHATPGRVDLELSTQDGSVVLVVTDDGQGFDPAEVQTRAQRQLGLVSMRERAKAVGGRLSVSARPGAGTTIRLEVPIHD